MEILKDKEIQAQKLSDSRIMMLLDVMKMITSTLQLEDALQRIVEAVTKVIPCEGCILWLYQSEADLLFPMTIFGFTFDEVGTHTFKPGEGTIGTAFQEQTPVITNDLKKYRKFVRKGNVVDRIVSLLDVPLMLQDKPIGVLDAVNKIPGNDFSSSDARLLSLLASQAAIVIGNARIHADIQRKAYELNVLHSITQVIGTNLQTNEVMRIIIEQTTRFLDMDDCSIFLKNQETGELTLAAAMGARRNKIGQMKISGNRGLIGFVADTRKTRLVSGADLDPYRDVPPGDYEQYNTAIASALYLPDKLIGVIELRDKSIRDISDEDLVLLKTITRQMSVFLEKANLYHTVQDLYLEVIKSLSEAVEAKDPETIGHCFRVSDYAARIAMKMGLSTEDVENIRVAGYLHDIGKIGVPDTILFKPDHLTGPEYSTIQRHCEIGAKILQPIEMFGAISGIVKHHHEWYDGTGYPDRLKGENIPLGARILAVADAFEAMTWNRPYGKKRTPKEALKELIRCSGSQFDPKIVSVFAEIFDELFTQKDDYDASSSEKDSNGSSK